MTAWAEDETVPRVVTEDDALLLTRAREGDVEAFTTLVGRHQEHVYGLAARMLQGTGEAEEVMQETFLSAWQNLGTFRGDSPFGAWVSRIAANFALMRLRRKKLAPEVDTEPEGPEFNERGSLLDSVADFAPTAEAQSLDAELRRAIEEATAALPEVYRQVFLLRDVEGLSYEDIAVTVGISVPAVKSRLHRARLSLRAAIDHFYQERES